MKGSTAIFPIVDVRILDECIWRPQQALISQAKQAHSCMGRWATVAVDIIWVVSDHCTLIIFFPAFRLLLFHNFEATLSKVALCASGTTGSSTVHSLHALGLSIKGYATFRFYSGMAWTPSEAVCSSWNSLPCEVQCTGIGPPHGAHVRNVGIRDILSTVAGSSSFWQFPALLVGFLAYLLLSLVLVIFPDGRFVPRWTYWLVVIYIPVSVQFNFFANKTTMWVTLSDNLLFVGLVISLIVFQVYRYWRVSNLVERQQTKWIVFCITLLLVMVVVTALLLALNHPGSFYSLIFGSSYSFPLSSSHSLLALRSCATACTISISSLTARWSMAP